MAEETTGIVKNLIAGAVGLIILVIISFLVVSTLAGAGLLEDTATTSTVTNESGTLLPAGYSLAEFVSTGSNYAITEITNATQGIGTVISVGNYTLDSVTGIVTNATATTWADVNISYTFIPATNYEDTTDHMTGNFTGGVDNVSAKIPTILLIAAVVLLFAVLVLLVRRSKEMGMGTNTGSL